MKKENDKYKNYSRKKEGIRRIINIIVCIFLVSYLFSYIISSLVMIYMVGFAFYNNIDGLIKILYDKFVREYKSTESERNRIQRLSKHW